MSDSHDRLKLVHKERVSGVVSMLEWVWMHRGLRVGSLVGMPRGEVSWFKINLRLAIVTYELWLTLSMEVWLLNLTSTFLKGIKLHVYQLSQKLKKYSSASVNKVSILKNPCWGHTTIYFCVICLFTYLLLGQLVFIGMSRFLWREISFLTLAKTSTFDLSAASLQEIVLVSLSFLIELV